MPGGNLTKLSNTPVFTGYLPSGEQSDGQHQVGAWFQNDPATSTGPYKTNLVEAIPAAVRVAVAGNPPLTTVGANQYSISLSLGAGQTCTLTPSTTDGYNNATAPVAPLTTQSFTYLSRNLRVVTISAAGVITPVHRGETEILVRTAVR